MGLSYLVIRFDYSKKFEIGIPGFGGLEEYDINTITSILPNHYLTDIELIAQDDPITQKIIKDVSSRPDMTDEQVEEQTVLFAKEMIKGYSRGFTQWLERQKEIFKGENFDDKTKAGIELLRKWQKRIILWGMK